MCKESFTEFLARVARSESDDTVKIDCIKELGKRGGESSYQALVDILQHAQYGYLQSLAADKLADLGDKRAIPYLEAVLATTQSDGVANKISQALKRLR